MLLVAIIVVRTRHGRYWVYIVIFSDTKESTDGGWGGHMSE